MAGGITTVLVSVHLSGPTMPPRGANAVGVLAACVDNAILPFAVPWPQKRTAARGGHGAAWAAVSTTDTGKGTVRSPARWTVTGSANVGGAVAAVNGDGGPPLTVTLLACPKAPAAAGFRRKQPCFVMDRGPSAVHSGGGGGHVAGVARRQTPPVGGTHAAARSNTEAVLG